MHIYFVWNINVFDPWVDKSRLYSTFIVCWTIWNLIISISINQTFSTSFPAKRQLNPHYTLQKRLSLSSAISMTGIDKLLKLSPTATPGFMFTMMSAPTTPTAPVRGGRVRSLCNARLSQLRENVREFEISQGNLGIEEYCSNFI